jgi:tRNA(Ile2) C34 agmatinyltransferase TiaS
MISIKRERCPFCGWSFNTRLRKYYECKGCGAYFRVWIPKGLLVPLEEVAL